VESNSDEDYVPPQSQKTANSVQSANRIRLAVRQALDVWRNQIISRHSPKDTMLRPKHILPDPLIAKLEKHCFNIKQGADIAPAVSPAGRDIFKHTRAAEYTSELAELIVNVVAQSTDPDPAPRKHGQQWAVGEPKPMYVESDIRNAMSPVVARMMETTNSLLRQYDITAVNAKESARLKRQKKKGIEAQTPASQASCITGTESMADTNSVAASPTASVHSTATGITDRDKMPPPPLPGKRPRGRPRGSKNKVRADSEGSVASELTSLASGASGSSGNSQTATQPPKKRPRGTGRLPASESQIKPKTISEVQNAGSGAEPSNGSQETPIKHEASSDTFVSLSAAVETPKKRRGRPPGSKNKLKNVASAQIPGYEIISPQGSPSTPDASGAPVLTPSQRPQRRAGRPPGPKNPANQTSSDQSAGFGGDPVHTSEESPGQTQASEASSSGPAPVQTAKKRLGRPPGSKNKPKDIHPTPAKSADKQETPPEDLES
jgi:hypothetical protein